MCRIKQLKPNYINIKIKGNKPQHKKTSTNAVRYPVNQEIKFLYCKMQNLHHQMYNIQLKCMHHCNGLWQHIQSSLDSQINDIMDKTYEIQQKIGLTDKTDIDRTQHHAENTRIPFKRYQFIQRKIQQRTD
jgi:hypothetical protein